jgi:hypothetical protein
MSVGQDLSWQRELPGPSWQRELPGRVLAYDYDKTSGVDTQKRNSVFQ